MLIRQIATAGDCVHVIGLAQRMANESPAYTRYEFDGFKVGNIAKQCIYDPDYQCLLAFKDEKPIGFMAYACFSMLFSKARTVDDLALYVLPEHRGSLAGPLMVKRCVNWAKQQGASEVRLGITTEIDNSRVEKLFNRLGLATSGKLCRAIL